MGARKALAAAVVMAGIGIVVGCASPWAGRATLRACPDRLARPDQVEVGLRREGTYRSWDPEGESVLHVVLERRPDRLVMVGLTAIGAEAFQVVQRGDEVLLEAPLRRFLTVPPELVLRDLHRMHFPEAVGPAPDDVAVTPVAGRLRITRPRCDHSAEYEPAR